MEQELDPLLDIGSVDVGDSEEIEQDVSVNLEDLAKELEEKANSDEYEVDDSVEHEEEEKKVEVKKKNEIEEERKKFTSKITLYRQEKRELKQKLNQLAEENQRLRELGERTERAATIGWEGGIKSEMDLVKRHLKESYDNGDTESIVNAQAKLAELSAKLNDVERYKYQQEDNLKQRQNQPKQPVQEYEDEDYDLNPHRADFVERNDFLSPHSINHDPRRAEELVNFSNFLNAKLIRQGKGSLIDTPNYYAALDKYVQENFMKNAPVLRKTSSKVIPVSSGSSNRIPLSKDYNLSSEERTMAKTLGMPTEEYKKFLLEGMQEKLAQKRRERN